MIRPCETAVQGYADARLRLMPPVFATEDYITGYRNGVLDRLYEARMLLESLRCEESKQ